MNKHSFTNPRTLPTRLFLIVGLVACLGWLALWCFRQPVLHGSVPADNSPGLVERYQKPVPEENGGQTEVSLRIEGEGADARQYLEQSSEGRSLATAVTEARYSINEVDPGSLPRNSWSYESYNPAHLLRAQFSDRGVQVRSATDQKWQIGLRLKGYGYGRHILSLTSAEMKVQSNRIEISKHVNSGLHTSVLTEWYENKPEGLEQGFTLLAPPAIRPGRAGRAREKLRLTLALTGDLHGEAAADRKSIMLKNRHGERLVSYSHLTAWDATGRELAARFRLSGREVRLEVDDAGASYPVTIDPTFQQEVLLTATAGGPVTQFYGSEVAISGSTAVVADKSQTNAGLGLRNGDVYVFVRDGATWSQQQKLTPDIDDPGPGLGLTFGHSVAISGNTIIVGAVGADMDGQPFTQHGHAFIFVRDGRTWTQQQVLSSDNGAQHDAFGVAVAVSGETAIVGNPEQSIPFSPASADVFVRSGTTWSKQDTLTGEGTEERPDDFGQSVALSGETAIVGADGHFSWPGAAYVFVRTANTWSFQQKLMADDGTTTTAFGFHVAISGERAIIGAVATSLNNPPGSPRIGAAYIFERTGTLWSQKQKLMASDGRDADNFGTRVAISGDKAVVGANATEKAYVFGRNGTTWQEQQILSANGGPRRFLFGNSVGASGDSVIVGSNGTPYVYQTIDSDGDGLPDEWEKNGITVDATGNVIGTGDLSGQGTFIDLKRMGADPLHKDIFVHADWMQTDPSRPKAVYRPKPRALKLVSDAFARAPVQNPDLKPGIRMHVDAGPNSIMNPVTRETWQGLSHAGELAFQTVTGFNDPDGSYNWSAVDTLKQTYFDVARRRAVFHYVFFCNTYPSTPADSSGISRGIPGADLLVTLGHPNWTTRTGDVGGTVDEQAGTFMHEFGHNLGLRHGGNDDTLFKPNHLSIMNYSFQFIGLLKPNGQRSFDYSRSVLDPLNEGSLDENVGINDPAKHLTLWKCPAPGFTSGQPYYKVFFPSKALDWNLDKVRATAPLALDINCDGTVSSTPLTDFNDWPSLSFDGGGRIGNSAGAGAPDQMSSEHELGREAMLSIVPPDLLDEEFVAPLDVVTFSPQTGGAPLVVNFDGSASTAVNGTIVDWAWDFGDGTTGTGATVTHTYNTTGDYFTSLTVTDSNGHVNLVPLLNLVTVTDAAPPTPTATPTPTPVPTPTPIPTPTPTPGPGDVDPAFSAAVSSFAGGTINKVITQPDGKIIVGGFFESFGGQPRRNIARVNVDGSCDPTFDPGLVLTDVLQNYVNGTVEGNGTHRVDLEVKALALQPDGKILVGVNGTRGFMNAVLTNTKMIVRLNADGTLDSSFNASALNIGSQAPTVYAIAVQPDGRVIVGGAFVYDSHSRQAAALARLNIDGSVDSSFILPDGPAFRGPAIGRTQPGQVSALGLQADGKIVTGGLFTQVGFPDKLSLARFNSDGSMDTDFNTQNPTTFVFSSGLGIGSVISAFALQPDGKILAGGSLGANQLAPGENASGFARFNSDGSRDPSFSTPFILNQGFGLALQADGKVVVVGTFRFTLPAVRNSIARLNSDGTLDTTFDTPGMKGDVYSVNSSTEVFAVALRGNGQIVVGGDYDNFNSAPAEGILQLNADGSRDQSFESNGAGLHARVNALVRQPDGRLLIAFDPFNGVSRSTKLNSATRGGIGRLNADGTTDTAFTSPFDPGSIILGIALQADGKVIIGGSFRLIGSQTVIEFTRLNANGTLDPSFSPPQEDGVHIGNGGAIALQAD